MKSLEKIGNWQVAEVELVYRKNPDHSNPPTVTLSHIAAEIFLRHWDMDRIDFVEQAKVMLLDRSNKVIAIYEVACGGLDFVMVDIRLIFCSALLCKASAFIFAHNHPSGKLQPSTEDIGMSKQLRNAGVLLNIPLLDSIIVTREGHFSLSDQGLL